jgi:hypothetical protein
MVQIRLPVDLAVLCTIVERLFGLAIMTARYRGLGSLHGVLLPRTWISALWEDFFKFKDRKLAPLWHLAEATEKILKDIFTGEYQRHAIWDSRSRSEFSRLYYSRKVTLRSTTGLQEQGVYLFQRYTVKIPTRSVCCTHVSVPPLEASHLLNYIVDSDASAFVGVRSLY